MKTYKEFTESVDGWIAIYNGKKLEMPKGKNGIDTMLKARDYARKELKVPKSKWGMMAIKPAMNEAMYRPTDRKYKAIKKRGQEWFKAYQAELKRLAPEATRQMDWDTATHLMNQGLGAKEAAQRYVDVVLNR